MLSDVLELAYQSVASWADDRYGCRGLAAATAGLFILVAGALWWALG